MTKIAIYAGSFDPITNGHLEVLRGSLRIADQLFVAIGVHATKKAFFTFEERVDLIYQSIKPLLKHDLSRLKVISFDNLLIDTARQVGATISIRGLRDGSDFDYEMQLSGMNQAMAPELQTVFLPANNSVRTITSTLIRQIASMGGDVTPFVPKPVAEAIMKKYKK